LGDHIRRRRLDLGVLQKDIAARIGVDESTVNNWECNRTAPEVRHYPHTFELLGYCPYDPAWTFGRRLRARREASGLSRKAAARALGVDEGTIGRWEALSAPPGRRTNRRLRRLLTGTRTPENSSP
jgi:transcriptional regulator with XRE-family HTH domain